MKVVRLIVGAALVASALTGCSVAAGYVDAGEKVISADNLKTQYRYVIRDFNAMQTSADNACAAQAAGEREDTDPTLVESPALAYAATYRKVWASYNARMNNVFEAGFVGPPGYPRLVPNYVSGPSPDFCDISSRLLMLKAEAE